MDINIIFDTDTSFRRFHIVFVIVIPPDIQKRHVAERDKKSQIFRRKVSAGNDEVDVLDPFRVVIII